MWYAAGLAAVNCRDEGLETMQKALEDMKAAVAEYHLDRLVEADLRFHRIICVASTNPHFVSLFDFLGPHLIAITQTRRPRRRSRRASPTPSASTR